MRLTFAEPYSGVSIRRDGRPLSADQARAPLFMDVGVEEHLVAQAPGYEPAFYDVKPGAGGEVIELRVALRKEPAPPPPPPNARRIGGITGLAAGGVSLALAAAFGVQFAVLRAAAFDGCTGTLADGRQVCPAATSAGVGAAVAARTRGEALAGVGGALALGGGVLLLTAPRAPVSVRSSGASIMLGGHF